MDPHSFIARAEAQRWIGIAEKLLMGHDLVGAKTFAIRARESDPRLEAADQILAIADTLLAAEKRVVGNNGTQQPDFYAILQLVRFVQDTEHIAGQYRRLAVALNPHQNRFPYSEQAFQLVNEAWSVLSNPMRKSMYDAELDFRPPQQMNNLGFNLEQHHHHQQHHQQQQQQHNFFSINHMGSSHEQELSEPEIFQTRVQQSHQQQQLQQHNFLSQPNPTRSTPVREQELLFQQREQEQLFQPQVQPFHITSPQQQSRPPMQLSSPPQSPFSWPQGPQLSQSQKQTQLQQQIEEKQRQQQLQQQQLEEKQRQQQLQQQQLEEKQRQQRQLEEKQRQQLLLEEKQRQQRQLEEKQRQQQLLEEKQRHQQQLEEKKRQQQLQQQQLEEKQRQQQLQQQQLEEKQRQQRRHEEKQRLQQLQQQQLEEKQRQQRQFEEKQRLQQLQQQQLEEKQRLQWQLEEKQRQQQLEEKQRQHQLQQQQLEEKQRQHQLQKELEEKQRQQQLLQELEERQRQQQLEEKRQQQQHFEEKLRQQQLKQEQQELEDKQREQQQQQKQSLEQNVAPVQVPNQVISNNDARDEESEREARAAAEDVNESPTFWTACPYDFFMFEYPRVYADYTLRCENCKRAFQAVPIPSLPPVIEGPEAYSTCWGFFPLGAPASHAEKINGMDTNPNLEEINGAATNPDLEKINGTGTIPNLTPIPPSNDAANNVPDDSNVKPVSNKNSSVNKSSGPPIYIDDGTDDVFMEMDISEPSDDSDVEWGSSKKKKAKRMKKSSGNKKKPQVLPTKARPTRNGRRGKKNLQDGIQDQETVEPPPVPVAESSKKAATSNPRRQSVRVKKELGKLDLNVEFNNNEGEEPAAGTTAGNRGHGQGEEDNIEGIGFFEGLDEFLSSLPILSVVNDVKVKAA